MSFRHMNKDDVKTGVSGIFNFVGCTMENKFAIFILEVGVRMDTNASFDDGISVQMQQNFAAKVAN